MTSLDEMSTTISDSAQISFRAVGTGPPVVLVHGARAHAGWWDQIAETLRIDAQVVALDLSGHGQSQWRRRYLTVFWAREVLAVLDQLGVPRAVLVGHSMGGRVVADVAARAPDRVAGLILVDTGLAFRFDRTRRRSRRPTPSFPDLTAAMAAYRLHPPQPSDPAVLQRIARRAVRRQKDGSWTFAHDPQVSNRYAPGDLQRNLRRSVSPVTFVHGTKSQITSRVTGRSLAQQIERRVDVAAVPGAHHHVPLDSPDELARLIADRLGPITGATSPPAARLTPPPCYVR